MRIKDFFTVPQNQKVTEKHLYRVLISSVCSILLCMSCLVGTTWAWFTVSIENTGNVIQIADLEAEVSILLGEEPVAKTENGGYLLSGGNTYIVNAVVSGGAGESELAGDTIAPAYVIMTVSGSAGAKSYYCAETMAIREMTVNEEISVSFDVSWTAPEGTNVSLLESDALTIGEAPEAQAESSADSEEPVEASEPEEAESEEKGATSSETAAETDEEAAVPSESVSESDEEPEQSGEDPEISE